MNDYRPQQFSFLPPAVKNILIINVIFFLARSVFSSVLHIDLDSYFGLFFPSNSHFRIWQFATHLFMHGGFDHILFNMLSFWMFGAVLENRWGAKRFLIFYFFTGIGAALCNIGANYYTYYQVHSAVAEFLNHPTANGLELLITKQQLVAHSELINDNVNLLNSWFNQPNNPALTSEVTSLMSTYQNHLADYDNRFADVMIGASGAVFGVLFAFGYLFPNTLIYMYFFIPIKAKYFVMIYGAIELISAWRNVPGDNIAHVAHLGGMLFGFILIYFWNKTNRKSLF